MVRYFECACVKLLWQPVLVCAACGTPLLPKPQTRNSRVLYHSHKQDTYQQAIFLYVRRWFFYLLDYGTPTQFLQIGERKKKKKKKKEIA